MTRKGIFLDIHFRNLQKTLMWWQTYLREKRTEFQLRHWSARSPGGCCCCSCVEPFPQGGPRAGQHLPLTALLSPRTTCLLLPSSQAAKRRLRAIPACPRGAEPAVTSVDHPQVSKTKSTGSLNLPITATQCPLLGWSRWRGRFLWGACKFWEMPAVAACRCFTPQAGFPPTSAPGGGHAHPPLLQKPRLMAHVLLGPHCWGETWRNLLEPLKATVTQGEWHI